MSTDTSKSLFDQALQEIQVMNFVAAEHLLQQASEVNEEGTTLYAASWAVLLALRDREEEAISILEERLTDNSTDPNLLLAYGLTLEKQKKFEDAEDAFREVLSRDAENPGALRGLAECLKGKGDLVEATRLAVNAFRQAPDNLNFAQAAANLLEAIDQPKTAFEVLELAAYYHPRDEEMVSRTLQACLARGEIDRAAELLAVVDINQPWAAGWKINFLDWRGQHEKADELIARTLDRPAGTDPDFLFQVACVCMRRGEADHADHYVSQILEQDPQHTGALRLLADLSLGRTDLDSAIDPLMKAFALSNDSPTGWRLFWSCVGSGRIEEAEETLFTLAEDPELLNDPMETARLDLAGAFIEAVTDRSLEQESFPSLDMLPVEASCGLLLEYLEAIEETKTKTESLAQLYEVLGSELGQRDPLLRLNRLYARVDWAGMKDALTELRLQIEDGDPPMGMDQAGKVYRLYSLLTALANQDKKVIGELGEALDAEFKMALRNILAQKGERNAIEQRWLDRLVSEIRNPALANVAPLGQGVPLTPPPSAPLVPGGLINKHDVEVVYETEDGQILTDISGGDYEIVEEEVEIDPEDENFEYVWIEEEVEVEGPPPQTPGDRFS